MKMALDHDLAIYSSHLPLDLHPEVGNNALLCRALGFKKCDAVLPAKGQVIGLQTQSSLSREELRGGWKRCWAPNRISPRRTREDARIGVVTGGAGGEVAQAAAEGVDTFITGEGPHHSYTAGGRTRRESFLRRPLRHGDLRRESAGAHTYRSVFACRGSSSIIRRGCEGNPQSGRYDPDRAFFSAIR